MPDRAAPWHGKLSLGQLLGCNAADPGIYQPAWSRLLQSVEPRLSEHDSSSDDPYLDWRSKDQIENQQSIWSSEPTHHCCDCRVSENTGKQEDHSTDQNSVPLQDPNAVQTTLNGTVLGAPYPAGTGSELIDTKTIRQVTFSGNSSIIIPVSYTHLTLPTIYSV